ncbi:TetR/AcrR family transcriptional regulator [Halalkalibacter urbisdiaboli]|uniref:TetR/AcrR family transcriptional regulator n=1 Tax=Halalkalibacter urbisdiaboli TaxID=1960589 RepID=UPI000B450BF7|nr:TetR-like C-terminal domain-containing protein [Halalkalibacter urbisdiaboli]
MSPRIGLDYSTVVQTAIQLADAEGPTSVTIATLAKKLGVRPPSLYNHISSLQDVRNKVVLHGLNELLRRIENATRRVVREEAVHQLAKAYLTFAREHPGVYEMTLAPDVTVEEIERASAAIVQLTVAIIKTFDINEEESLHAVRGIRSMLHGFASLERNGGFGLSLSLDDSYKKMINAYLHGLTIYRK